MQQDFLWLEKGKNLLMQLRARIIAPPVTVRSPVWYSGLGIEPAQFTEQLARLQISLNGANAAVIDEASRNGVLTNSSIHQ
jgi:hypothetical protein